MKLSRVIFLTILVIIGNTLFYACCMTTCGCGASPSSYKVINYKAEIRRYSSAINNNPSYSNFILDENSRVPFNEIAIALTPEIKDISYWRKSFALPGVAFACDPAVEPTQTFTDISIISDADYQTAAQNFQAGENLAPIFNIHEYGSQKSIGDFLSSGTNYASYSSFYFLLIAPPTIESFHTFTITVKLSDGSFIESTTQSIKILP